MTLLLSEVLYNALRTPYGIVVKTTGSIITLRKNLIACRKELGDPDLECLVFHESRTSPNEVWIKKVPTDAP